MPPDSPLTPLRPMAAHALATNASLLEQAPATQAADGHGPGGHSPTESLTGVPGGIAGGLWERLKHDLPKAASNGERIAKGLGEAHLRGLGPATDAIDLATADDKRRAIAGIAGSSVGEVIGGLVPGAEPVTVPMGGVIGNWAGHALYDHRHDIRDGLAQGLADRIRPYMPPVTRDRF